MPDARPNLELTTSEQKCLRHYNRLLKELKRAPTMRELADALGMFPNAARHLLGNLEQKGHLEPKEVRITQLRLTWRGRQAL